VNTWSVGLKGQDFELRPFGSGRRIRPGIDIGICHRGAFTSVLLCIGGMLSASCPRPML